MARSVENREAQQNVVISERTRVFLFRTARSRSLHCRQGMLSCRQIAKPTEVRLLPVQCGWDTIASWLLLPSSFTCWSSAESHLARKRARATDHPAPTAGAGPT